MYAYDDRRGRGSRDTPPSSSARYYDSLYANPARGSPRHQGAAEPSSAPAHEKHRRKSVPVNMDEARSSRRAHVAASDDGRASRDAYGSAYPDRASRHDAEAKTSAGHKRFREKRGGYETDEAQNLRRAKSYSPRRAAREAEAPRHASPQAPPKSGWDQDYAASGGLHRSATNGKKSSRGKQYYDDDPRAVRGPSRDRGGNGGGGYEYGTSPTGMPRPPMGDYSPYKSSPLSSSRGSDEKIGKHRDARARERDTPYYGTGYSQYEPEPAAAAAAPRRGRHGRVAEDRAGWDNDGYSAAPPRESRSRARPPPPPAAAAAAAAAADDYEDPYDRATRSRHRHTMPPPAGPRYGDDYDDPYGPPRRRSTSVNHPRCDGAGIYGGGGGGGGGDLPRDRRASYDDRPLGARYNSGSSGSSGAANGGPPKKAKGKKIGKQAGKLFMTHAMPVLKQEAVPFLTKAAQAYFEQRR